MNKNVRSSGAVSDCGHKHVLLCVYGHSDRFGAISMNRVKPTGSQHQRDILWLMEDDVDDDNSDEVAIVFRESLLPCVFAEASSAS